MVTRRKFIGRAGMVTAGIAAFPAGLLTGCRNEAFASSRPPVLNRKFTSVVII